VLMKTRRFSHSLVATVTLSVLVVLMTGLTVAVGLAQSDLPQPVYAQHTFSPDTLQQGEPALGSLTVHNQSTIPVILDAVSIEIAEGFAYAGQAFGSDVTDFAQRDGSTLRWAGPFDLPAGETFTVRYWVVAAGVSPGQYQSRASISLGKETMDVEGAPVTVEPASATSMARAEPSSSLFAPQAVGDVTLTKTADSTEVEPGSALRYTVVLANGSNSSQALDKITDVLPVPFQYVGLAAGSQVSVEPDDTTEPEIVWHGSFTVPARGTLTLRYLVWIPDETQPRTTPYVNTVRAALGSTSTSPAQESVTVIGPDIQMSKTAWPAEVLAGELVTYTVVMENTGNGDGIVERISDTLPVGFAFKEMLSDGTITDPPVGVTGTIVWDQPFAMPVGALETLVYQVKASGALEAPVNEVVAVVNDKLTDRASASVQVHPRFLYMPLLARGFRPPYFEVTKSVSPAEVVEGEEVVYTIRFTNPSSEPGQLDTVYDNLPTGFTFLQMEGGDVTAPPTGTAGTIYWDLPSAIAQLGPKASLTLRFRVQVSNESGTYVNEATATTIVGRAPKEPGRATVVVKEPYLLWEDFESGTDGWEPFLNYWRLEPEQWYLKSGGGYAGSKGMRHTYWLGVTDPERGAHDALYMYQGPGSDQWTNYRLEVRTRSDAKGILGLWVRGKYIPNQPSGRYVEGYYVTWQPGRNRGVDLSRLSNTGASAGAFYDPVYLTSGGFEMEDQQWYLLAVEVRGSNIKVFVDGIQVIDYNDSTYSRGTIGFYGYKMEDAAFDNVLVTPLD
jgi:uncharacterized repeat protein (TIGR01451 family)